MKRILIGAAAMLLAWASCVAQPTAASATPPALKIKPLAEKKIAELPAGPLYWRPRAPPVWPCRPRARCGY
jgi:hypothetical protein